MGIFAFLGVAYALSSNRKAIDWKTVVWGMGLQIVTAVLVLGIPSLSIRGPFLDFFSMANDAIVAVIDYTAEGSRFIFGSLASPASGVGFVFAFVVLPTIISLGALMAVGYHLGVMQKIVHVFAVIMQKTMRISGAESLSTAANIFVGQTEAPLLIKPYVERMTRSELLCIMIGGMANTAGGVLAAYVGLLRDTVPNIAGHLLTASIMSAPATIAISKLLMPETGKPETLGRIPRESQKLDHNVIDAAARGASEGLSLALNVAGMLLAFIALVAMANGVIGWFGHLINFPVWGKSFVPADLIKAGETANLSIQLIFGWAFSPVAWLMGIPWQQSLVAGGLLGEKLVLNEFVAYVHMSQISKGVFDERTQIILSYALCGFANFSSIAIQIGGIGGMAPTRKRDLAQLGILSVVGGSLVTFIMACVAGILV